MSEIATTKQRRPRRSMKMLPDELALFLQKVESFETKEDAMEYFGLSRVTLRNISIGGSGKESTIKIIREKIGITSETLSVPNT